MIDSRYGLKYSFPHSVVHIVDNSGSDVPRPLETADDPSLYATIVATAMPMGKDREIVNLTRSDILHVAFGSDLITTSDIEKYGQSITYAASLINQGAPVRLLRITPEDAEYGFSVILVQWRVDDNDQQLHVRFKTPDSKPDEIVVSQYKNTDRLNKALVKKYKNNAVVEDGITWKQRAFVVNISAGRGSVYNNFVTTIDSVTQSKRPANIAYLFTTIDTRTNTEVEHFSASLINFENTRQDSIETVNSVVSRREDGSSVVVPYINETAIREVYEDYMSLFFDRMNEFDVVDGEFDKIYKSLTVNTFDILYGNYIYNGSGLGAKLPWYSVDMRYNDIAVVPAYDRFIISSNDSKNPRILYNVTNGSLKGLDSSESVVVGSVYLTRVGTSNAYPKISVIAAINQYSGNVTSITIPKVYGMKQETSSYVINTDVSTRIAFITTDTIPTVSSGTYTFTKASGGDIYKKASMGKITTDTVFAAEVDGSWELFCVTEINVASDYAVTAVKYESIYDALDWSSRGSDTGNIVGIVSSDTAFFKPGYMYIAPATAGDDDAVPAKVCVNDYDADAATNSHGTAPWEIFSIGVADDEKLIKKFGVVPTTVTVESSLYGTEFDLFTFAANSTDSPTFKQHGVVTVVDGGTGWAVGDKFVLSDGATSSPATTTTTFTVDAVSGGKVTKASVDTVAVETSFKIPAILTNKIATVASADGSSATGLTVRLNDQAVTTIPDKIARWQITGTYGSLYRFAEEMIDVPENYYSGTQGINPSAASGGVAIQYGSTGFFDDASIPEYEFKYRYSALLVKAFKGQIDPRILSPTRCPAKYLFDGGMNTVVGQTILPNVNYPVDLIINASTIFTDDDREEILFNGIGDLVYEDIDVKQAMYDLTVYRCYNGIPEQMRPIGYGSGLSLHLDSGMSDSNTIALMNTSFNNRFGNPNVSWDIGGYVAAADGLAYTYTKRLVDNLIGHCKTTSINKPYTGNTSAIRKNEYISYFPDIDTIDWDLRETWYNFGGNNWIPDINGNLVRKSQRTLYRDSATSDLVQESNSRTLSQLVYILQNKIDSYLLEYNDDGVLKTLSDEVNNMFSSWVGNLVDSLEITFERDKNVDGGDIIVCYVNVTFRGLILRVPIIVNVNKRAS